MSNRHKQKNCELVLKVTTAMHYKSLHLDTSDGVILKRVRAMSTTLFGIRFEDDHDDFGISLLCNSKAIIDASYPLRYNEKLAFIF